MPRRSQPLQRLLVNRHRLAHNRNHGTNDPVLSVQQSNRRVRYADEVEILDAAGNVIARLVHRPESPLSCGATVWIEAYHGVTLKGRELPAVGCKEEEFGDTPTLF